MSKYTEDDLKIELENKEYEYGFYTDIESDTFPIGLNEDIVRAISKKKEEPQWMTDWRIEAYRAWTEMSEPNWANVRYEKPDFQAISYYSAPKQVDPNKTLSDVDPELLAMYKKLGISIDEQKMMNNVAMDIVVDSVSVATTFKKTLGEKGIIFCPISEAIKEHPELVRKYLGSVVPQKDNFYAALNSAVFSDGSFCYIPKGVRCPMELSTYFRINQAGTGQFERTLVIADAGSYVSYLEGCTAPSRDENQLHAAVVELIALDDAEIKYSTVQNWYPGNKEGKGGVYNFVTKRGICEKNAKISWTQVETGSAVTWKYPSVILKGNNSVGEFYSIAVTNNHQQADTGTKMIHLGKNTKSTIISKGISAGKSQNSYRGLVQISARAENARNFSQCDSLLMGNNCGAHTFPYIESKNPSAKIEHEATTSKIGEDQVFYCNQRGIPTEKAIALIVNGFSKEVLNKLPMEFAVEVKTDMLQIKNLHARVEDKDILRGINLTVNAGEVHAIMGPNGSGKSTLSAIIAGNENYEVTEGEVILDGEDLADLKPEERAHRGVFLSFQYPIEIPGVSVTNFMKTAINETRKAKGLEEMPANEMLKLIREKSELLEIDRKFMSRSLNEGFSGGEKKRNEIFQMAMLEPKLAILDETDSGLDIDALRIVANGVNKLKSDKNAVIVITHYQRLLDYIVPDFVHVLYNGKIVKSGGKELAYELEEKGYDWIKAEN